MDSKLKLGLGLIGGLGLGVIIFYVIKKKEYKTEKLNIQNKLSNNLNNNKDKELAPCKEGYKRSTKTGKCYKDAKIIIGDTENVGYSYYDLGEDVFDYYI